VYHSVFDIFRIGPGPSSSRLLGPYRAAQQFLHVLSAEGRLTQCARLDIRMYGALALAGRDLGADGALLAGLHGQPAERCDWATLAELCRRIDAEARLHLGGRHAIVFDRNADLRYSVSHSLGDDVGGVRFEAFDASGQSIASRLYCCTSFGDVIDADQPVPRVELPLPFAYDNAAELLAVAALHRKKIAEIVRSNECAHRSPSEVRAGLLRIASTMCTSVERGVAAASGRLPGSNVSRRAALQKAAMTGTEVPVHLCALYATAVAEESAGGAAVASAPTLGSAGPVAALLVQWQSTRAANPEERMVDFLLAAGAIGGVLRNAGLRAAGCQSAVGAAAAMAAAGYVAASGGSNAQIAWAAERALDRHVNLSCDSRDARVQQPCIERNGAGAAIAYTAAQDALRQPDPRIGIDSVAASMVAAARAMTSRPKSGSFAGVAVNVMDC